MARSITGRVSSKKTNKTIFVTVQTRKTHPLYKKQYIVTSRFMAHDEKNVAEVGDSVLITECRPLSARKHFILTEILQSPTLREEHLELVTSEDKGRKPIREKVVSEETEKPKKEILS